MRRIVQCGDAGQLWRVVRHVWGHHQVRRVVQRCDAGQLRRVVWLVRRDCPVRRIVQRCDARQLRRVVSGLRWHHQVRWNVQHCGSDGLGDLLPGLRRQNQLRRRLQRAGPARLEHVLPALRRQSDLRRRVQPGRPPRLRNRLRLRGHWHCPVQRHMRGGGTDQCLRGLFNAKRCPGGPVRMRRVAHLLGPRYLELRRQHHVPCSNPLLPVRVRWGPLHMCHMQMHHYVGGCVPRSNRARCSPSFYLL